MSITLLEYFLMEKSMQDIQHELNAMASRKGSPNKYTHAATLKESYWWLRRMNKLTLSECPLKLFSSIVHLMGRHLRDSLIDGHTVCFPHGMGKIMLTKEEITPNEKHGYLGNNISVDWAATRKLWLEDEDAKKNKVLIRYTNRTMYRVVYNKRGARFTNLCMYDFLPCRLLKRAIAHRAKSNEINNVVYNYNRQ